MSDSYLALPISARLSKLDNVPIGLRQQDQWVGFELKPNGNKLDKTPYIAPERRRMAKCNDPATWRDFNTAIDGLQRGRYNAAGYALAGDVFAIDLDRCLDQQRSPSPLAADILAKVRTYTEVSASGNGLHLFGLGRIQKSIKSSAVELYGSKRFIVVTGEPFNDAPQELRQFTDDELMEALGAEKAVIRESRESEAIALISLITSDLSDNSNLSDNQTLDLIIRQTLPKRAGERNRRIFDLARGLKFDLGLAGKRLPEIKPIVKRWHMQALAIIGTKPFDDTWADFTNAWTKAHSPLAGGILATAMQRAEAGPLPPEADDYDSLPVRRLVAVCRELQAINAPNSFYLSSHVAAGFMGMSQPGAWKALRMLEADGVLASESSGNQKQATRYRYIGGGRGVVQ